MAAQLAVRRWLTCLLCVGGALRLLPLGAQSLWFDEVFTYQAASRSLAHLFKTLIEDGQHPPLHYLITWLLLRCGEAEFWLRLPSALLGLAAIPGVFALTRRFADDRAGLIAAGLFTVSSYPVHYSHEARNTMPVCAAVVLASWLLLEVETQPRRWIPYGLSVAAGLFVSNLMLPTLVGHGAFVVIARWPRPRLLRWLAAAGCAVASFGGWLLAIKLYNPDYAERFAPGQGSLDHAESALFTVLADFAVGYSRGFSKATAEVVFSVISLGIVVACALALSGAVQLIRERRAAFVLTGLVGPLAFAFLLAWKTNFHQTRYAIGAYPFFLMVVAVGASHALRVRASFSVFVAFVIVLNLVGVRNYLVLPVYHRDDFRSAARFFERRLESDDLLIFDADWEDITLRHYLKRPFDRLHHWMPSHRALSPAEFARVIAARLGPATRERKRVWLVLCYDEVTDPRGVVRAWLDEHWRRAEERRFAGYPQPVRVYRYERRDSDAILQALPRSAVRGDQRLRAGTG